MPNNRVAYRLLYLCFLASFGLALWVVALWTPTGYARPVSTVADTSPSAVCYTINDSITSADPVQTGMLVQTNNPTQCDWSPTEPPLADTDPRHYKRYNFYFPFGSFSTVCVTVNITATGCPGNLFSVAHGTPSYTYRGDIGAAVQGSASYTFMMFRGSPFYIDVHEVTPNSGCSTYTLTISTDIPCSSIIISPTPTPTITPTITPTATPTCLVTLNGHLTYQGLVQPHGGNVQPITLRLQPAGGATSIYTGTTDQSGNFSLNLGGLPAGAYNYRLKSPRYLASAGTLALTGACSLSREFGTQSVGDFNNDNCVDVSDFTALAASYGRSCGQSGYNALTDCDSNCVIGGLDFSLFRSHFGQCGAP